MTLYTQLTQHYRVDGRSVLELANGDSWPIERLEQLAAVMGEKLRRLGAETGDRVLVQVPKSVSCIALYLACLRHGFVFVPLNTAYTSDELAYFIEDADPSVVVLSNADASGSGFSLPLLIFTGDEESAMLSDYAEQELEQMYQRFLSRNDVEQENAASIIYTSGTTGRSKGAVLSHHALLSNASALVRTWGFSSQDVLLHALPVFHVHGLFIALHTAMLSGAKVCFLATFDIDQILRVLPQCSVMMGVPTYYVRLMNQPGFDRQACQSIRLFISGSAPLSIDTFESFRARTGHTILERYGMSETNVISSNTLNDERMPGSVGFALGDTLIRIANDQDQILEAGITGAVQVRGSSLFSGYWRRPEVTAGEFTADGYFRTGDLGYLDRRGRLTLVGRAKDLIISGGLNVYPAEIERVLNEFPGVTESAVVGAPDADFGERVEAFIVSERSGDSFVAQLHGYVRSELANFKRPKAFHLIETLPRNTMGKVQKTVLRAQLESRSNGDGR